MAGSVPVLEIERLEVLYGQTQALFGVDLHVSRGEFVVLIGANGAGKTSLLKAIMGLVRTRGEARFEGSALLTRPSHERASLGIGYVPEGRRVFPDLSVAENLAVGAYSLRGRTLRREGLELVYQLFPRLAERRHQAARTLSGGEQQMLAIGRALVLKPRLLLVDEVSMGLAPIITHQIFAVLRHLNQEGLTVLLVEQNARQALAAADRGYVLETGTIRLSGNADRLREDPNVVAAYIAQGF